MADLPPRERARRKMAGFYAKCFPGKLDQVDRILDKYPGQEDDVVRTFRTKYPEWNWDYLPPDLPPGFEPTPDAAVAAPAAAPPADHNVNITLRVHGAGADGAAPGIEIDPVTSPRAGWGGDYFVPPTPPPVAAPADFGAPVTRGEVEHAFAVLEQRMAEAHRSEVAQLEGKLDRVLQHVGGGGSGGRPDDVLPQLLTRLEALAERPAPTTPPPARQRPPPAPQPAPPPPPQRLPQPPPPPQPAADVVEYLRHDNSRKAREIESLSRSTQQLQAQLAQQQRRHHDDVAELQQRIHSLESRLTHADDRPPPAPSATPVASQPPSVTHSQAPPVSPAASGMELEQIPGPQRSQQATRVPLGQRGPAVSGGAHPYTHMSPSISPMRTAPGREGEPVLGSPDEMGRLQQEVAELRRRDDLSRKLLEEKQALLSTMFALSRQQQQLQPAPPPTHPSSAAQMQAQQQPLQQQQQPQQQQQQPLLLPSSGLWTPAGLPRAG